MSSIPGRDKTALLVIDVQVGVVAHGYQRDAVVARIAGLVERARAAGTPVVWVQHSEEEMPIGCDDWQLVPELKPIEGEPVVHKNYRSSFESTNLEDVLAERNIGKLIVCGAQSNNCVRSTGYAALDRGYDVLLVEDAHTTDDGNWDGSLIPASMVIDEQNRTMMWNDLPGRSSRIAAAADIQF